MKKADIVVGERYAYAEQHEWEPGRFGGHQKAIEVEILEVGVERRTGGYGTNPKDGVRCRIVDDDPDGTKEDWEKRQTKRGQVGHILTGTSRNVRELWSEYKPRHDLEVHARAVAKDETLNLIQTTRENLKGLLPDDYDFPSGALPKEPGEYDRRVRLGLPNITFSELADMLWAARVDAVQELTES